MSATAILTDDTELARANSERASAVLAMLPLITSDPTEQAAALLTAAAVVIERACGAALAPAAFAALTEPTIDAWERASAGRA